MQKPEHVTPRPRRRTSSIGRWQNSATALLPVLACFLGGATQKWAEGIVVALFGLLLLLDPPRFSLGPVLNGIFFALVVCAGIAFLPESWFFQPAWRTALIHDFGIKLPQTITPQPWVTIGCLISFLAGLCWFYRVAGQDLELRGMPRQLRLFVFGITILAALSIFLHLAHTSLPFWFNQRGFGPFPNRNQTANLFGLTAIAVLACGQDDIRRGKKRWIAWLLAFAILLWAIILNFSRAGIAIVVVGSALWLVAFALRKGSIARIAAGISVLLVLLTSMLVFGGQTLERFNLRAGSEGVSADFRWLIFQDAFQLLRDTPWCGLGLGNFEPVFAIFRQASFGNTRALHPESDWLWVWAELGWSAVIFIIAGAALLIRRVFPLQEGTNQRFRLAALIGSLLFALHALVDVSGHRVGTSFAGLLLFGLALRRPLTLRAGSAMQLVFRLLGIVFLASGIAWVVAARYEISLPGALGAENERRLASVANRGRKFDEAIARTTRAMEWAPLDWQLYFVRALGKVGAKQPVGSVLSDFRRARFLEPNAFEVPYQEGVVWLTSQPLLAVTAWREALRRAGPERVELYGRMLSTSAMANPDVSKTLEEFGSGQPDLAIAYLERVSGERFMSAVGRLLERDPNLQAQPRAQKVRLFSLWSERGDLAELARAVEAHPDWLAFAWRGLGKHYAKTGEFRRAYELARQFGTRPTLPEKSETASIEQLQRSLYAAPNNYGVGFALYQEQIKQGKVNDALMTARHFTEEGKAPAYFYFLEAEAWAAEGNWERAWAALEKYLGG